MEFRLFITGNFLCGECGWLLVPKLEHISTAAGGEVPTGRVFLTRHEPHCSLRDKNLIANLPETKGQVILLEETPV